MTGDIPPKEIQDAITNLLLAHRTWFHYLAVSHSGILPLQPGYNIAKNIAFLHSTITKEANDSQEKRFHVDAVDIVPVPIATAANPDIRCAFDRMVKQHANSPDVAGVSMFVLYCGDVARCAPILLAQDNRDFPEYKVWSPDQWKVILNKVLSGQEPPLSMS